MIMVLHKDVEDRLAKSYATYKADADRNRRHLVFNPGDLVMIYLGKERRTRVGSKLAMRRFGAFKVVGARGPNSYEVDNPTTLRTHLVCNASNLSPYYCDMASPERLFASPSDDFIEAY